MQMERVWKGYSYSANIRLTQNITDRISLTLDTDFQFPVSYGHDLLTCKSSRSTVSQF